MNANIFVDNSLPLSGQAPRTPTLDIHDQQNHDVDGDDGDDVDGDDDDVITPPLSLATAHLFPAPNLARHTFAPELYLVYVWISTFLVNTFLHR